MKACLDKHQICYKSRNCKARKSIQHITPPHKVFHNDSEQEAFPIRLQCPQSLSKAPRNPSTDEPSYLLHGGPVLSLLLPISPPLLFSEGALPNNSYYQLSSPMESIPFDNPELQKSPPTQSVPFTGSSSQKLKSTHTHKASNISNFQKNDDDHSKLMSIDNNPSDVSRWRSSVPCAHDDFTLDRRQSHCERRLHKFESYATQYTEFASQMLNKMTTFVETIKDLRISIYAASNVGFHSARTFKSKAKSSSGLKGMAQGGQLAVCFIYTFAICFHVDVLKVLFFSTLFDNKLPTFWALKQSFFPNHPILNTVCIWSWMMNQQIWKKT
ncbi:hypothetical protein O181_056789 [Austropuccinia psidii MF-1]|uniref:Uncharacterized protein n=1 Tax=Austropuccinia psidii MF-1 TaxID=1389203 RepID=A0A9Q3HW06_9BASI|nr:hypothetical protein [Austropuccinia psidii MF-1]